MKDPERLLSRDATAHERALLEAGASEEPPEAGRRRLATLLGVSAGLVTITGGSSAAANTAAKVTASWTAKWVVFGGIAAGVAAGGLAALVPARPAQWGGRVEGVGAAVPAPTAVATGDAPPPASAVPLAVAAANGPERPEPDRGPDVRRPGTGAPSAEIRKVRATARATPPAAAVSIAEEIQSLDTIRRLVRSARPGAALARLSSHRARFRGGTFAPEASVLQIEALAAMGRKDEARARLMRFLGANPSSPHAKRLSKLVGLDD